MVNYEDALYKTLDYMLDNEDYLDLLCFILGDDLSNDSITNMTQTIMDSLIVEQLSEKRYKKLQKTYGRIGAYKSQKDYVGRDLERQKIEKNFSQGINEFFEIFDECFEYQYKLRKKLGKYFKNYRFKDINIVNDYTLLFFAFKLHDNMIENAILEDYEILAENIARETYGFLKNPHGKKQVTVTRKDLKAFCDRIDADFYVYNFLLILIEFVRELYYSEKISDIVRYDFFYRFQFEIGCANSCCKSYNSIYDEKPNDCETEKERINSFIYNLNRKYKDILGIEKLKEHVMNLKNHVLEIKANFEALDFRIDDNVYKQCENAFDNYMKINEFLPSDEEQELNEPEKSLCEYAVSALVKLGEIKATVFGEVVTAFELVKMGTFAMKLYQQKRNYSTKMIKTNPYTSMQLFNIYGKYKIEYIQTIEKCYEKTLESFRVYIRKNIVDKYEDIDALFNGYNEFTDLNAVFDMPILKCDVSSNIPILKILSVVLGKF